MTIVGGVMVLTKFHKVCVSSIIHNNTIDQEKEGSQKSYDEYFEPGSSPKKEDSSTGDCQDLHQAPVGSRDDPD